MGLSGPAPSFAKAAAFLGKQVFKGVKDDVLRHVHNALYSFLCENDLIFIRQSGFRSKHSTRLLTICYSTLTMTVSVEWFW